MSQCTKHDQLSFHNKFQKTGQEFTINTYFKNIKLRVTKIDLIHVKRLLTLKAKAMLLLCECCYLLRANKNVVRCDTVCKQDHFLTLSFLYQLIITLWKSICTRNNTQSSTTRWITDLIKIVLLFNLFPTWFPTLNYKFIDNWVKQINATKNEGLLSHIILTTAQTYHVTTFPS